MASNKTISVSDGKHRIINISIDDYINGINNFEISMDALKICNQLKINILPQVMCVAKLTIKFLIALRGHTQYKNECSLLDLYNIGIQPKYTEHIKKHIAHIKWLVYINVKNNIIDNNVLSNVALLSGLCLYFNELDLIHTSNINKNNNNHITNNYDNSNNNYNFSNRMQPAINNVENITRKYTARDII